MQTLKVLGQLSPSAATLTAVYTVPAATTTAVSSLIVTNRSSTATSFRVSIAVAGIADATNQYIFYDAPINSNDTFIATIGLTLGATDSVRVYATLATLNFALFGVENS